MKLRKCAVCNSYSLQDKHCSKPTDAAHPARFSFADKYAVYRRKAKFG